MVVKKKSATVEKKSDAELNEILHGKPLYPYKIGGMYLIRTVTMILTGKLVSVGEHELVLTSAAWIADTGRYMQAVATGVFNEVEPYPVDSEVLVGRTALIDAVQIPQLPMVQK